MKILVTGGAGFIGSALVKSLEKIPDVTSILVLDNLSTSGVDSVPQGEKISFEFCDVTNKYSIERALLGHKNIDYVFHYAATVGVNLANSEPLQVLEDMQGIRNILQVCLLKNVKRIFYSSSSEVYGDYLSVDGVCTGDEYGTPMNPVSTYSVMKLACERYIQGYNRKYKLPYTIFRFFNTYGKNQRKDFVVPRFIDLAVNNKPITVYGGSQTRSFCHISDNLKITTNIFKAAIDGRLTDACIYNVGNDSEISIQTLADIVLTTVNGGSGVSVLPSEELVGVSRRKPNIDRIVSEGFFARQEAVSIVDGINRTL